MLGESPALDGGLDIKCRPKCGIYDIQGAFTGALGARFDHFWVVIDAIDKQIALVRAKSKNAVIDQEIDDLPHIISIDPCAGN